MVVVEFIIHEDQSSILNTSAILLEFVLLMVGFAYLISLRYSMCILISKAQETLKQLLQGCRFSNTGRTGTQARIEHKVMTKSLFWH